MVCRTRATRVRPPRTGESTVMLSTTGEAADGGARESPVVLVSLLPRSYSDTIGEVVGALRPDATVHVVEPGKLSEQVVLLRPDLVLCSQPYAVAMGGRPSNNTSWVEYYPYAEPPEDEIRIDGRGSGQRAVELSDLLAIVDRALAAA